MKLSRAALAVGLLALWSCAGGSGSDRASTGGGGGADATGGSRGAGGALGSGGSGSGGSIATHGGNGGDGEGGDGGDGRANADGGAGTGAGADGGGGRTQVGTGGQANPGSGGRGGGGTAGGSAGAAGFTPCPTNGSACVVMPLGDSITFGFGSTTGGGYRVDLFSQAAAAGKSITFVGSLASGPATVSGKPFPKGNEGHSGYAIDDNASTKGISPLVDQAISTFKPNIILLMIGTNDMHYSVDLANAPARLGKLIDQLTTDAPSALLVVATIIPANGAQNTTTQAYNAAIPGLVRQRVALGKHLVMVDLFAAIRTWSFALYTDSEHPNDAGYGAMAKAWYLAIQNMLH